MTGILSSVAILLFIASIFFGCYLRRIALHPETGIMFRKSDQGSVPSVSSSTYLVKEPTEERATSAASLQTRAMHRAQHGTSILRPPRSPFRAYESSA
ncbi:unnamed protein product [Strongylus vulgaris]|uniref:Uncharacterized protein n=1 Tax=Strongylus vulgaris TaxID=40348 RepID=A0A3P7KZT9_STRVU|nr:unnamed protein product [Strongylus vulgaris]